MLSRPIYEEDASWADAPSRRVEDPYSAGARRVRGGTVPLPVSEWVTRFIRIKDGDRGVPKAITFEERRYLRRIYDSPSSSKLLITARQTEKSTTLSNMQMADMGTRNMYTSLFVSPSAMQTTVYSKTRLDDIIQLSPLMQALTHPSKTMNILEKEFLTGSKIYLRYAFLNADRIRGLSVNSVYGDEVQDLLPDVLPIIEEASSHFEDPRRVYAGTPKTFDNNINTMFSEHSNQGEWVVPCERHGATDPSTWYWNVLMPENIGKRGPICAKCKKPINPEHPMADWVSMRGNDQMFESFRIPRIMVPWFFKSEKKWKEILDAREAYSTAVFYNEVMALSYDSGTRPITKSELIAACDRRYRIDEDQLLELSKSHQLYAGLDHGANTDNSKTVMAIGGYVRGDDKFQILWLQQFNGDIAEGTPKLNEFFRIIDKFNIKYIGADYGMGFDPNKMLAERYGPHRIKQFQYTGSLSAKVLYKKELFRYLVYRTPVMSDIFTAIKQRKIRLPHWEDFRTPFGDDVLRIFSEYSESSRMIRYGKPSSVTDDSFHAILYCFLASFFDHPRHDVLMPLQGVSEAERMQQEEYLHTLYNSSLDLDGWDGSL